MLQKAFVHIFVVVVLWRRFTFCSFRQALFFTLCCEFFYKYAQRQKIWMLFLLRWTNEHCLGTSVYCTTHRIQEERSKFRCCEGSVGATK